MESDPLSSASIVTPTAVLSAPERLVVLNLPFSIKLNRGNFLTWRCQIEPALHGHGLYKYITDDPPFKKITTEGAQSDNPSYLYWYQQDQLILTWLRSSLTETILNQTVASITSAQLWKLLQQSFSASSRARLTELRRALQTTTKGGASCLEFCQKMRSIADELAFIGNSVSDDDLVIQILTGLGSDFNSVVAAANAKENLTFAELQSMLLSHESLIFSQLGGGFSSSSSQQPAALFTQPRSGPRNSNPRPNKGNRSRYNHQTPQSQPPLLSTPSPRPTYQPRPNTIPNSRSITVRSDSGFHLDKDTVCQICSKRGHNAKICWYRTDLLNYPD